MTKILLSIRSMAAYFFSKTTAAKGGKLAKLRWRVFLKRPEAIFAFRGDIDELALFWRVN